MGNSQFHEPLHVMLMELKGFMHMSNPAWSVNQQEWWVNILFALTQAQKIKVKVPGTSGYKHTSL